MVKSVVAGCTFFEAIRGYNTAISIYTDCDDMMPVGRYESKERALSWVGKPYPYHLFDSNYHRLRLAVLRVNLVMIFISLRI